MIPRDFAKRLCDRFCSDITVNPVPAGLAVSTALHDSSGDRFSFFVIQGADGLHIEDDGSYLAQLIGRDIPISDGTRGEMLDAILKQSGAYWDRETYEIKTEPLRNEDLAEAAVAFLSALVRVRDLELLTRESIRSTFRDDVLAAVNRAFGEEVEIEQDAVVDPDLADFPADLVLRPVQGGVPTALYLVSSDGKLNEALLAHAYAEIQHIEAVSVVALLEEREMKQISRRKFQRAQNRALPMPIFRGDEAAAMGLIRRQLGIAKPANLLPA